MCETTTNIFHFLQEAGTRRCAELAKELWELKSKLNVNISDTSTL